MRQEIQTQMHMDPLRWNMYTLQDGQTSNDSVLSDYGIQYTTASIYELPQQQYYPAKRKTFIQYMKPIIFQEIDFDTPGIPLEILKEDISVLTPTIVGGMDRVFRRYPNMENINLRIMVCLMPPSISLRLFDSLYSGRDIIHAMALKMRFSFPLIPRVPPVP